MPRSGGSRAAAQVHDAVRRDILNADARRLGATLNRDLIRPVVDLNMGPQTRYPKIELGLPDDSDVKVFAEIVAMLADRGLRVSQKTILDKLGIAQADANDAVLAPAVGARSGDTQ
jgi:phage gp29-like protein